MYLKFGKKAVAMVVLLLASGCDFQSHQFALPNGNTEKGEIAYVALQCNACHSRSGSPSLMIEGIDVQIGGAVTKVDSYAALVTSVINPSHRIKREHKEVGELPDGESAMQTYNEVMTVQQLVDLVTMLQREYKVQPPIYPYGIYH